VTSTAPLSEPPDLPERLTLPTLPRLPGWALHTRPDLLVLTGRPGTAGVRPEVRVELTALGPDGTGRFLPDVATWRELELRVLRRSTSGFEVEDSEAFSMHDREVLYQRYAWLRGRHDLLGEEWAWEVPGGLGGLVAARMHRADYDRWCDLTEDLADLVVAQLGRE